MPTGNDPALPQKKTQTPMLGGPDALTHLALRLQDDDDSVRAAAADALATIGTDAAVDLLRPLLADAHPFLQQRAVQAIATIGTAHAVEALITYMEEIASGSYEVGQVMVVMSGPFESDAVAERVVRYLGRFVDLEGGGHFTALTLETIGRLAHHHPAAVLPFVRPLLDAYLYEGQPHGFRFNGLLRTLPPAIYLDELTALALNEEADPDNRRRALLMLKNMRAKEATDVFLSLIEHEDGTLAHTAHQALKRVRKREDIPEIFELLTHPDWQVRRRAVNVCTSRRLRTAIPHLLPLLDDPRGPVRLAAARALVLIGAPEAVDRIRTMMEEDRSQRVRDGIRRMRRRLRRL
jgi:hypothetical protein